MESTGAHTLFTRIGGMNAVDAAVDLFYQKVMLDDRINHFFFHIDMNRQSGKMKAFLAFAFGAPFPYPGLAMREAHQHMHLTEEHFDAVAQHLVTTLQELNVSADLIEEVVDVAMSTKKHVLNQ
jgi:hemoglobin